MSLKERINNDIKSAMLAKQKERLLALRAIKSMILLGESEKGSTGELTEIQEVALLQKAAKQRKESAEIYAQQGRKDLEDVERLELEVIQTYLPEMMSESQIESALKTIAETIGAKAMSDLGKLMGAAVKELQGKADGKLINEIAKKILS